MKLGGTRDRDDEDVDVFLVDAPPTPPTTTTVTLGDGGGRRRRWPELALVVVGIAVVVGVGLLGGDDDLEAAPDEPTTTVKPKPATTDRPRRSTTTQPDRFTTTTLRPTTTTTTWPQVTSGTGPLLPGQPTGTALAVIDGQGIVSILDLDTGDRCRTQVHRDGAYAPWGVQNIAGPLLVQAAGRSYVVGGLCDVREVPVDVNGWIATSTEDAFWMVEGSNQTTFVEYSASTYEKTGREVDTPAYAGPTVVAVGDDLVVSVAGDLTLVHPGTGEQRPLGTGYPLAAHGRTLALMSCPELDCRLVLLDVDTDHRTVFEDVHPAMWSPASFSPDGSRLLLSVPGGDPGQPAAAIVHLGSGGVRNLGGNVQSAVFTSDSRWIITIERGRLGARALDESNVVVVLGDEDDAITNVQTVARVR